MLDIKYRPYSLRYGHDFFYMVYSVFSPLYLFSILVRRDVSQAGLYRLADPEARITKITKKPTINLIVNMFYLASQTTYLTGFLIFSFVKDSEGAVDFGGRYPDSLTYKVLNNLPIFMCAGIVVISVLNSLISEDHLRKIYAGFCTTSVDNDQQACIARTCILSVIPEMLLTLFGTVFVSQSLMRSHFYKTYLGGCLGPTLQRALNNLFIVMLLLSSVMNIMVRYKPVFFLTYASICLREHLAFLNAHILCAPEMKNENSSNKLAQNENRKVNEERAERHDNEKSSQKKRSPSQANVRYFHLSNLYQLERHLTQMGYFIYDLDKVRPESVFILTVVSFMSYFFLAYNLSLKLLRTLMLVVFYTSFSRILPLILMLRAGSRLEKESRNLVSKLETVYLRNKTQSLIYKQMKSSHLSLNRTLHILEKVAFNCHGLMKINLDTLKSCCIYVLSIIGFVVQYDSFIYINVK